MSYKEKDIYCKYCGCKLRCEPIQPERIQIPRPPDGSTSAPLAHAYDQQTGKRNTADEYVCPRYYHDRKWYRFFTSPHDRIIDENSVRTID